MSDENENIPEGPDVDKEGQEEGGAKKGLPIDALLEKIEPLKEKMEPILAQSEVILFKLKKEFKNLDFKSEIKKLHAIGVKQLFVDFIQSLDAFITVDKKKLKLIGIILALVVFFVLDIMWIVCPPKPKAVQDEIKPDYTMEEVASAMEKYKEALLLNPHDYKAFIEIGKIYRVLDEKEKAKVAFFQALEYAPENDYGAEFELAGLYICDKQPEFALEVLNRIKDDKLDKKALFKKGRYFARVANLYYLQNHLKKSYDIYNKTLTYLHKVEEEEYIEKINTEKRHLLIDLSDYVYYEEHDLDKALAYLKECQKIKENPWAFARMGYLFFEQPKMAAEYFERAFNYNPSTINHEVFINVLFEAIKIAKKEKRTSDKEYYKYVLDKVRADRHQSKVYKNLRLTNVEAYVEKIEDSTLYNPVVYFQASNASENNPRDYVKVRAVFYKDNNEIVGHRDEVVVKPIQPLWMGTSTGVIRLVSNRPITEKDKNEAIYKVVIYVSKDRPDQWRLAGSTFVKHH